jgi:hypothetical protein
LVPLLFRLRLLVLSSIPFQYLTPVEILQCTAGNADLSTLPPPPTSLLPYSFALFSRRQRLLRQLRQLHFHCCQATTRPSAGCAVTHGVLDNSLSNGVSTNQDNFHLVWNTATAMLLFALML